jgi:hypothetical protein
MMINALEQRLANGGRVEGSAGEVMQLVLPEIPTGKYGLAQVDNYSNLPRRKFPHRPPLKMTLEARVSAPDLAGTWGFGLWNDPFSIGFGGGGMARALPVLPNAAWFFYGSKENYLSLRDDQPGAGFQAKTFRSPRLPTVLSILAAPGVLLMLWPAAARLMRKWARLFVTESARPLSVNVQEWHSYELEWTQDRAVFTVDQREVLRTPHTPPGRLGLVIWIDNQFFRCDPTGKIKFGYLAVCDLGWLEVRGLRIN